MKKNKAKLSFLSYFLCSTVSFAMEPADNEIQYNFMKILKDTDGKPTRIRVSKKQSGSLIDALDVNVEQMQFLDYKRLFPAQEVYDALDPKQSIPVDTDLGSTSKTFLLSFQDGDLKRNCEWTDQRAGKVLKHGGCWFSDPDTDTTTRILKFNYTDDGREIWFSPQIPIVKEIVVSQARETTRMVGNFSFDGRKLEEEIRATISLGKSVASKYQSIPGHDGYITKLAIPFPIDGYPFGETIGNFTGEDYKTCGKTLNPHIDANRVIYISKGKFYWPKVTHELCERGHGQNKQRVGFTVISTRDNHKAAPVMGLQNAVQPRDGAYTLKSVRKVEISNKTPQFEETWEELSADSMIPPSSGGNPTFTRPGTFIRTVAEKLASFPGIGTRRFQSDVEAGPVAQMRAKIEKMDNNIRSMALKHPDANSVLIVGYAGSGKSVLINLLLGGDQNVIVHKPRGSSRLGALKEYSGIGHTGGSGTSDPQGFWFQDFSPNDDLNVALWDLCGLGDPGGDVFDIANAFNLRRLFKNIGDGNIKIIIATTLTKVEDRDGPGGILAVLNDISAVFPDINQLKRSVSSLIVSKHNRSSDLVGELEDVLTMQHEDDDLVKNGEKRRVTELSANARALVQYLIDEENKKFGSRVILFPEPASNQKDKDTYREGGQVRESVLAGLQNTDGNVRPDVDPLKIVRKSSDAVNLAASINSSVAKYIGTQGIDSLFRLARSKVIENVQSVKKLKENLVELQNNLTRIRDHSKTPEKFLKKLSRLFGGTGFFDGTPVETGIAALSFLAEVNTEIEAKFRTEWAPQLTYAIEALGEFSKEVPVDKADLRGAIVGASDINRYFKAHPDAASLSVYVTHAFIMDEAVDRSGLGTSIKLIAPYWKILGQYSFNLTGKKGGTGTTGDPGTDGQGTTEPTNGKDGKPGQPGKCGGNFFGQGFAFSDIESLSVIVNGGQGGDGGKGGKGGKGRDRFGNMQPMTGTASKGIAKYSYGSDMIDTNVATRQGRMQSTTLHLVNGGTQNVKDWIGPDWHHQISVWLRTMTYTTPGEAGKNGGKGGKKGLGGKPGQVLLLGPDNWKNYEKKDGVSGTNKGDGGDGGAGGVISKRTAWTEISVQGAPTQTILADVWDGAAYDDGHALGGGKPADPSDTDPDNPSDAGALDRNTADYITFYKEQAQNPLTFPWVQRFPGLFD